MDIVWSIGLIVVSAIIGFIAGSSHAYRDMVRNANELIITGEIKKKGKKDAGN